MLGRTNINFVKTSDSGGGELTPCTVTINADENISENGVILDADLRFLYDGEMKIELLTPINFPLTIQTYVNCGFIIYGLSSSWGNRNIDIKDESSVKLGFVQVYGEQITSSLYIIPTSSNCSFTLYLNI